MLTITDNNKKLSLLITKFLYEVDSNLIFSKHWLPVLNFYCYIRPRSLQLEVFIYVFYD